MNKISLLKKASSWLRFAGLAVILTLVFFVFSIFAVFSKGTKIIKGALGIKDKAADHNDKGFIDEVLAELRCPFLYVWNGKQYVFANDILISPNDSNFHQDFYTVKTRYESGLCESDIFVLDNQLKADGGKIKLRIKEIEAEESFLDRVELQKITHSSNDEIYVSGDGKKLVSVPKNRIILSQNAKTNPSQVEFVDLDPQKNHILLVESQDISLRPEIKKLVKQERENICISYSKNGAVSILGCCNSRINDVKEAILAPKEAIAQDGSLTLEIKRTKYQRIAILGIVPEKYTHAPKTQKLDLTSAYHAREVREKQDILQNKDFKNYAHLIAGDTLDLSFKDVPAGNSSKNQTATYIFVSDGFYTAKRPEQPMLRVPQLFEEVLG